MTRDGSHSLDPSNTKFTAEAVAMVSTRPMRSTCQAAVAGAAGGRQNTPSLRGLCGFVLSPPAVNMAGLL